MVYESAAPDLELYHRMTQLLVRAAASSSVVRGRRMANADRIASVVASALARRREESTPSPATVTLAEVAMRIFHLAVDEWATASAPDIALIFIRRFDALRQVAGDRTRIAPRRAKDRRTLQRSNIRGADALFSIDPAFPSPNRHRPCQLILQKLAMTTLPESTLLERLFGLAGFGRHVAV
jgi:hypothetical protein